MKQWSPDYTEICVARGLSGLEFKAARNLDDTVQTTAADGVRRSDLTEGWTVDVEDGVTGPTKPETGSKNSSQEVSVIQNVECVRTNLETHPFIYSDALCQ